MRHCPHCQYPLGDGITFCSRCGTKVPAAAPVIPSNPVPQPISNQKEPSSKAPPPRPNRGLTGALWVSLVVNILLGGVLICLLLGVFGPLAQQKQLQKEVAALQSQVRVLEEIYRGLDAPTIPTSPTVPTSPGTQDAPTDTPDESRPPQTTAPPTTVPPTAATVPPVTEATESSEEDIREPSTAPTEDTTPEPESYDGYYVVNTKEYPLNIRSSRSTDGKILGTIPIGTRVYITEATGTGPDDWGYVVYNGIRGYVAMQYLLKQ